MGLGNMSDGLIKTGEECGIISGIVGRKGRYNKKDQIAVVFGENSIVNKFESLIVLQTPELLERQYGYAQRVFDNHFLQRDACRRDQLPVTALKIGSYRLVLC